MKIGFISDAHGHYMAFNRGLSILHELGAEAIYFLGDAIGYLPGIEVLKILREQKIPCIRGNHEDMLLSGSIVDEHEAIYRHREVAAMMPEELSRFVEKWPESVRVAEACGDLLVVHGSPIDPMHGYVYPDSALSDFDVGGASFVFMGNTHRPFIRDCNGTTFVNVGSCGMCRDCGSLGAVCLLDSESSEATIFRYDISDLNEQLPAMYSNLSPALIDLFARQEKDVFGVRYEF